MDNRLELSVISRSGRERLPFTVDHLWNGGWAGRNRAEVQKHVDELAEHGIPGPTVVPIYFPLSNNLLTTSDVLQAIGPESSGEVEYVLLFSQRGLLVGVATRGSACGDASQHPPRRLTPRGRRESQGSPRR